MQRAEMPDQPSSPLDALYGMFLVGRIKCSVLRKGHVLEWRGVDGTCYDRLRFDGILGVAARARTPVGDARVFLTDGGAASLHLYSD